MQYQRITKQHLTHVQGNEGSDSNRRALQNGLVIAGRYRLLNKIGQGSFGQLFKTENIQNGEIVATKFEKREENSQSMSLLVREIKVLLELKGAYGFPEISFYGRDERYNYFMMDYMGLNFEQLLRKCNGKFTTLCVLHMAQQIINRIEILHAKNLIHRDIKPENFVIGHDDISMLYLIDFGLSKYYRDVHGKHIPYTDKKGIIGTARYASIHAHKGKEQSRRDDLEAIGYVLVYLAKGKLPWMNIQVADKDEKYQRIMEKKINISIEKLCEGLPKCFLKYFQHVGSLQFSDAPNYGYLKQAFSQAIEVIEEIELFMGYDWEKLPDFKNKKGTAQFNTKPISPLRQPRDSNNVSTVNNQSGDKSGVQKTNTFELVERDSPKKVSFLRVPKQLNAADAPSPDRTDKMSSVGTSKFNNYETSQNIQHRQRHAHTPDQKVHLPIQRKGSKSLTQGGTAMPPLQKMSKFATKKSFGEFDDLHELAEDDAPKLSLQTLSVNKKRYRP